MFLHCSNTVALYPNVGTTVGLCPLFMLSVRLSANGVNSGERSSQKPEHTSASALKLNAPLALLQRGCGALGVLTSMRTA